jgi:leucyl aminopeptidase
MKQIINVKLGVRKAGFAQCRTDLLVLGHFSDAKALDKDCGEIDGKLRGAIGRVIKLGDFKGKEGTSAVVYGNGAVGAKRIMLVGLGEKKKATLETLRKAAACAAKQAVEIKAKTVGIGLHRAFDGAFDLSEMGRVLAEGTYFGSYRYDEFVTESENGRPDAVSMEVIEPDSRKLKELKKGLETGVVIGRAQSYSRTVANRPANIINPGTLAVEAKKLARQTRGLSCTVFDEKQMAAKGMGGILAVGSGSKTPPRFIVVRYEPNDKRSERLPMIGLVGKAITFDSGGISIKPAANMDQMKLDKSGGIAVLGTMKAIAELKLPVRVLGIVPSAENMPGGASYRPGDIITTFSGKTVEVQNTDAEGRMILCDGLAYAVKEKCDVIIDIATLTGACMVALGKYKAGLMGNDDGLIKELQDAAEKSGESVWPMPSGDEYAEEMKSKIADLKNVGSKWGGACTGAAFLRQFVKGKKWAHMDMAGMDLIEKGTEFCVEGSSGFGVRLLITYLMNLAGKK